MPYISRFYTAIIVGLIGFFALTWCAQEALAQDTQVPIAAEGLSGSPTYPAGLDDPAIPLEDLRLRVLPLPVDELAELAKAWRDNIRVMTEQIVDQTLAIRNATGGAEAQTLEAQREALLDERDETFAKAATVVSSLTAKGGDPELVAELKRYRVAISIEETASKSIAELIQDLIEWLISPDGGLELLFQIGVIIGALLGLFLVARIMRGRARRVFARMPSLSRLLQGFLATAVYWLTIAFGLMIVLAALGVNITPLFALVGGASFIIAFAMQDTLGNLAAGLMIMPPNSTAAPAAKSVGVFML